MAGLSQDASVRWLDSLLLKSYEYSKSLAFLYQVIFFLLIQSNTVFQSYIDDLIQDGHTLRY